MSLSETATNQFVTYSQTIRESEDPYVLRKKQKDRYKHIHWINTVMKYKEIILTYIDENGAKQKVFATRINPTSGTVEWPNTPLIPEVIHGETVLEDQYIRFFSMPSMNPTCVHIDSVLEWTTSQDGMYEIDKEYKSTMYV
jgi:hypothetical protein